MDRTCPRRFAVLLVCTVALWIPACGGGDGGGAGQDTGGTIAGCAGGPTGGAPRLITGTVRYERLVLKTTGLGPETVQRPARFVDVEVQVESDGACLGRTSTDANGAFAVVVAPNDGTTMRVTVFSRTAFDAARDYTVHSANPPNGNTHNPNNAHTFSVGGIPGSGSQNVVVDVPYASDPARPAIGFGVLDTVITCIDQVAAFIAPRAVQPVHVYARVGNNTALGGTSFYRPQANAIALLSGANGQADSSDTDYFDDAVVAHELGHYVENTLSHSWSRGGPHSGEPLEPNFAFSEGQATGFGNLLIQSPFYIDSVGTNNALVFAFSVENAGGSDPGGIGGELTVAEIIFDLADGAMDTDNDNVETPLSSMYVALTGFDPNQDAPYIGLLLDRIDVAPGNTVDQPQLTQLMNAPEDQGITYPIPANQIFPQPIALGGGSASGTLDSTPGMNKNRCRGITSSAWYRLSIGADTSVTITLSIGAIAGSGDNLDLFLHRNFDVNNPVASSVTGGAANEQINTTLSPGQYVIRVEANCTGAGSRANYTLQVN